MLMLIALARNEKLASRGCIRARLAAPRIDAPAMDAALVGKLTGRRGLISPAAQTWRSVGEFGHGVPRPRFRRFNGHQVGLCSAARSGLSWGAGEGCVGRRLVTN